MNPDDVRRRYHPDAVRRDREVLIPKVSTEDAFPAVRDAKVLTFRVVISRSEIEAMDREALAQLLAQRAADMVEEHVMEGGLA